MFSYLFSGSTKCSRLILYKPVPAPEATISLRSPSSFWWAKVLEIKIWAPGMLIKMDPF